MWPFSKKQAVPGQTLVFKSGEDFLAYQCKFGQTDIRLRQGVVAVVLDSRSVFGTQHEVEIQPDGVQQAALKIASEDGGFTALSSTITAGGEPLRVGDVVIWVPITYDAGIATMPGVDPRFGWVGYIVAKIKPEIDPSQKSFEFLYRYDQKS